MDNEEYILAALFAVAKDFDSLRRQDLKNHPKSDAATKWRSMQGRSRALVFRLATTALTEVYPDELSIESTSYDSELMNSARNTFCEVVTNISNAVGSGYSEKNIENDALRDILNESESSGGVSEQTRRNFIENLVIMAAFLDCASDREPHFFFLNLQARL
ncbi:hypothetical protein BDN70DRAFT_875257 [Pholiota conissans]|uniref:Uncharacterized protein n=1 Tax=Pholiota conissans TaxID=109636 RepID=A0A9P5Z9A4_9AGAR|nr:hypothetical protein BDN70DRAFT_875257 [Pholiota conissans]